MTAGLVIVGASYAGVQMAATARDLGFAEPILLLSEEPHAPYQKPPLSKGYLSGKVDDAALPLRGEAFFTENAIDLVCNTRVAALDLAGRRVLTADGVYGFRKLMLATGSRPRRLAIPGADLDGVHVLRTLDDARALRAAMRQAERAVVVGGGYIGLEIASSLIAAGLAVMLLEAADQVLARVAMPPLARYLARKHREKGVALRLGMTAKAIVGDAGRVQAVECDDGRQIPADLVVIGIGAVPNGELAIDAGLATCSGVVVVDDRAQTSVPDVFAAGDCACAEQGGRLIRLESVQNAGDQARAAAAAATGHAPPARPVPWFWSDQYDFKVQSAGLAAGYDEVAMRGNAESDRFALFYFRGQRLIAVDTVNRPGDHLTARKLLARRAPLTPQQAADESTDLRALLDQAAAT
ncbi:NAD(P)/FAD-dependent oxidoreductase [Aliidongia dinghuensis]|uniref:NAD(P)/FAD-dependent oxidoreductase n=1 Tax=Aliidongia dinghuensis TaxID=1867774 RepID=UPI001663FAA5|nr:FAD-dependent oxidoreductase [Aliidongia dinghuensis]